MSTVVPPVRAPAHRLEESLLPPALAVLSGLAAGIHAAVVSEHLEEDWLFGAFFVVLTVFQAGWALAIVRRPTPGTALVGAVASAVVLVLWVLSRTTGMPIGPHPWIPEAVGPLDVASGIAEVGIVALALRIPSPSSWD